VRRLIWTFAILSTVSTVATVWLWIDLREERHRNLTLEAKVMALEAPPTAAASEKSSSLAAAIPASIAANPTASVESSTSPRAPAESVDDEIARQRELLSDPKYRDAWREQRRVTYALRRSNLIRVVGLTPEQADSVLDLQIDRELNWIENDSDLNDERARADEFADQRRLREMLGEEKSQQLQAYMESRATRMRVDDFRSELSGADALRDDQVEPLIAALHGEDVRLKKAREEYRAALLRDGNSPDARGRLDDRQLETVKATYDRMHSAAAPVLTSSQLDRFDAMLKRDLDRRGAEQRIDRIRAQVDPADTSPSGSR
jgi:hypothetical protein